MDTIIKVLIISVIFTIAGGPFVDCIAQEKSDVIVMKNGESKTGKVLGVTGDVVKFKYSGEDLEYEFKKDDIGKIEFASGRVEMFNEVPQSSSAADAGVVPASAGDRKNKLAVLPFEYVTNDPSITIDPLRTQIQSECINIFRDEAKSLTMQDPMVTNSILAKNNISFENFKTVLPQDMAAMLDVEYVVYGSFNVENKGQRTSGSSVTTYKDKENKNKNDDNKKTKSSGSAITTNNSYTITNYDTKIELNIYNDKGNNIYSDSRKPFSGDPQGAKGGLQYLIKRCPFGSKYRN